MKENPTRPMFGRIPSCGTYWIFALMLSVEEGIYLGPAGPTLNRFDATMFDTHEDVWAKRRLYPGSKIELFRVTVKVD